MSYAEYVSHRESLGLGDRDTYWMRYVKLMPAHLTEDEVHEYALPSLTDSYGEEGATERFESFLKAYRLWHNFGVEFLDGVPGVES